MSRTTYAPREEYTGAGNLDTYSFDFKIEALTQLLVVVADDDGVEIHRLRGDDATFIDEVIFDPVEGGGTVILLDNLPTDYRMILLLANDSPTQEYEFKNKFDFTLARIERALDFVVGAVQRLAYRARRAIQLHDLDAEADFDMMFPPGLPGSSQVIPTVNVDGDGWADVADWVTVPDFAAAAAAAATAVASAAASAADAAQAALDAAAAAASTTDAAADAAAAAVSAAAAAASEAAAAASAADALSDATDAAASEAAAAASAAAAATAETNAETAETNAETAQAAAEAAQAAAEAAQAAAELAEANASAFDPTPDIQGTRAAPVAVVQATGVVFTSVKYNNIHFLEGSGGAVDLSALNPQIQAGTAVGQRLTMVGRSDTNTIKIVEGNGIALQGGGELFLFANTIAEMIWDGTNWVQVGA